MVLVFLFWVFFVCLFVWWVFPPLDMGGGGDGIWGDKLSKKTVFCFLFVLILPYWIANVKYLIEKQN